MKTKETSAALSANSVSPRFVIFRAASLVDLCGMDVFDRRPGRWVFFDRDFTALYGDWREWRGMRASHLYFLPLRDDSPPSPSQRISNLFDPCGNPDTRRRRK